MANLKIRLDVETLLPLLDLWTSLVFKAVCGPNNIDLMAYIEQSNHYLDSPDGADYTKLLSECGPVAYPGAAVYFYSLVNLISGRNVTWAFGQYMHIVLDVFRMWLLVKVYKRAFGPRFARERKGYVLALLLLQAKYKFASVVFNFNDTVMQLIALIGIYFHLRSNFWLGAFFMGCAASVKMSALLHVPGILLVVAFERGLLWAPLYLIAFFGVQLLFGLEFILKNAKGYFDMAYDFGRKFDQSESVNFHYISQETQHSKWFEALLLSLHLGFLVIFLLFKWTGQGDSQKSVPWAARFFKDIRLFPMTFERRTVDPYYALLIILTSNFIGMVFSRGTHQQFYAWYSFSFPFLLDACSETFGPLAQLAILVTLELAWSVNFPHRASQGHALNFAHFLMLFGLLRQKIGPIYLEKRIKND